MAEHHQPSWILLAHNLEERASDLETVLASKFHVDAGAFAAFVEKHDAVAGRRTSKSSQIGGHARDLAGRKQKIGRGSLSAFTAPERVS